MLFFGEWQNFLDFKKRKNYTQIPPSNFKNIFSMKLFIFLLHTSLFIRFHLHRNYYQMLICQYMFNKLAALCPSQIFINQSSQWTLLQLESIAINGKLDKNRQLRLQFLIYSFFKKILYCICSFWCFFFKINIFVPNRM